MEEIYRAPLFGVSYQRSNKLERHAVLSVIENVLDNLSNANMLEGEINFTEDLALLGPNSPLDSLAFISFLTQLEEKLSVESKEDIYIVLSEISGFDISKNRLQVRELSEHIMKMLP